MLLPWGLAKLMYFHHFQSFSVILNHFQTHFHFGTSATPQPRNDLVICILEAIQDMGLECFHPHQLQHLGECAPFLPELLKLTLATIANAVIWQRWNIKRFEDLIKHIKWLWLQPRKPMLSNHKKGNVTKTCWHSMSQKLALSFRANAESALARTLHVNSI